MAATQSQASGLFLNGQRESGQDVRVANVTAAVAVSNIVKSSLGPVGLDKMLVDDIGDVLITNDGATILKQLEVEHPAARVLVDLAQLQDNEVGDGTTSVVIVAAELLRRGADLIKNGLHPTTIISGFRTALKAAVAFLKREMVLQVSELTDDYVVNAAKTSMSSKIIGKEADFFAKLAVDAVRSVKVKVAAAGATTATATSLDKGAESAKPEGGGSSLGETLPETPSTATASTTTVTPAAAAAAAAGESEPRASKVRFKYPLNSIHIIKAHGQSSLDSHLLDGGFALNAMRAAQGMPTVVDAADGKGPVKVAMLDMNLQRHRMGLGVQVVVKDPAEVENIQKREMDITKERIRKIINAGARVVLTTKGVDDLCLKYFVEAGILAARRVDKDDLKRLAKATGGQVVLTMADMDGNETFDADCLGTCESVREVRIGDGEMLYLYGCAPPALSLSLQAESNVDNAASGGASTIVLRGANDYMLDEMDRALHDSLSVVKRMLESNTLVVGGGAVEAALSVYLEKYATTLDTREQVAIQEYADALLVIPKTLAVNAAKDSSELVAQLRAAHAASQKDGAGEETVALKHTGLDLVQGQIRDNLVAGVVEPAISKIKSLRFATEAAITILRIDDRITVNDDKQQQG